MGLIRRAYEAIGELSKPDVSWDWRCNIETIAYKGARIDDFSKSPETYWFASQALFALGIVGIVKKKKGKFRFYANNKVLPVDEQDKEIIVRGLNFFKLTDEGISYGYSPAAADDVRKMIGLESKCESQEVEKK